MGLPDTSFLASRTGLFCSANSEQRLGPEASPQRVYDYTYQMYPLNRKRIGSDPNLIFAGQRLSLPPIGEG